MRTLLATAIAAAGFALMASAPVNATPLPVTPKAAITHGTDGVEQVHWRRHHRRHWGGGGYYPGYYGYGYPRYRSYGYYGGGFPGFSLYIGPRHRWGRW